jgi:ABC-type multidrug transport system fused ATPase/permease subunit
MSHLKAILPYARPYRAGIAFGLLLVVLANLFTVVGPYLMKLAIDALDDPDVTHRTVLGWAGLIVTAAVVGGAARFGMRQVLNGISRRIECDLRNDFFLHLLSLDAAFFSETRTGDLMSRATNDTVAVRMAVGPAVMYSVNTAVSFTGALALMVWISPRLTLFALIPMVLLPPVVLRFGRAIHRRFEKIQEQFSTLSTMVQENLTGVRIVRAYGQERAQARDFDALSAEYMERNMNLVRAAGLFRPVLTLFTGAAMVVVLWLGGREVIANRSSIGDFVAFGFYLNFLTWPMIALGWVLPSVAPFLVGRSSSKASRSDTQAPSGRCSETCPSGRTWGRPWRSLAPRARGRRLSFHSSPGCTTLPPGRSSWTASRSANLTPTSCGQSSASFHRTLSSSPSPSKRTSVWVFQGTRRRTVEAGSSESRRG